MPFSRDRHPAGSRDLYRSLRMGRNVDLFLLDQRQYRDDQPCGDNLLTLSCAEAEGSPRNYLGQRQLGWLKGGLESSRATWKLVGNQLMVMAIDLLPGNPINKDSWDGYGRERRELLEFVARERIRDVSFLTGDIHTFFAGEVGTDGRGPESVATEFVGGSITAQGIPEEIGRLVGVPQSLVPLLTERVRAINPHLKYDDQRNRGYGILEASPSELNVEFKAVDALRRDSRPRTTARFRVDSGTPRLRLV
jgi:alkaline phosphatase D